MTNWRDELNLLAAIISAANLFWFARKIWLGKIQSNSPVSWLMFFSLDVVLVLSTKATGQPYGLPLSYAAGALPIAVVSFYRCRVTFGKVEAFSLVGAIVATLFWQLIGAEWGIVFASIAMTFATIPLMKEMLLAPDRQVFWLFANTVVVCAITLAATWPWTIGGSFLAGSGVISSTIICLLVSQDDRPYKVGEWRIKDALLVVVLGPGLMAMVAIDSPGGIQGFLSAGMVIFGLVLGFVGRLFLRAWPQKFRDLIHGEGR